MVVDWRRVPFDCRKGASTTDCRILRGATSPRKLRAAGLPRIPKHSTYILCSGGEETPSGSPPRILVVESLCLLHTLVLRQGFSRHAVYLTCFLCAASFAVERQRRHPGCLPDLDVLQGLLVSLPGDVLARPFSGMGRGEFLA